MKDSSKEFKAAVWPLIAPSFPEGSIIIPMEARTDSEFAKMMDIYAGIDLWHVDVKGQRIRGIASRVQWGRAYNTFTVRRSRPSGNPTEWEKRREALNSDEGWLCPSHTVQSYVKLPRGSGKVMSVGLIKTRDLFDYLEEPNNQQWERNDDGTTFFKVPWWRLKKQGYPVEVCRP